MPRVIVTRATVIQGAARWVGEVLDISKEDLAILGARVRVVPDEEPAPEPEQAIDTTAEHAELIGRSRTRRRSS